MIKIAFCDDDPEAIENIEQLLEQYRIEAVMEIEYAFFSTPFELLTEFERGARYNVLYLDILMPGINGIDVAAEIRRMDQNVKIIFLTSSAEFAVQSYTVDAYHYLLKPVQKNMFYQVMDAVLSECRWEQKNSLILRCKNGITRVEPWQIEYCEVLHRTLYIYLIDGKTLESTGSLEELCARLESSGCFMRPHRSFLINLEYVHNLSYRAVTMKHGAEIPVPRGKYAEIKKEFFAYAFENRQVIV